MVTIRRQGVTFVIDGGDVVRSAEVSGVLRGFAESAASAARASAPVETGEYRRSIRVESAPTRNRARYRVVARTLHAVAVEARTGNLKRALARARGA